MGRERGFSGESAELKSTGRLLNGIWSSVGACRGIMGRVQGINGFFWVGDGGFWLKVLGWI